MILDEERLRGERSDRKTWKSRVTSIEEFAQPHERTERRQQRPHRAQRADEEDAEYRLAIEASKYQEEEDRKKRQSRGGEPDDEDLAKAIKLSKEEEDLRKRELEEHNTTSLFDDDPIQTAQPTGFNQGYQQQTQVDWAGNPIDPNMQQQPTGYMGNMGNMYTGGFPNQATGYQNGYSNGFAQQPTGFDPYGQQQQQQLQPQQPQQQQLQPQQTSFNPYQQTGSPFQAQQPELLVPAATNNPWATNNQQPQALKPTPTGSNNPFASSFGRPQTSTTPSKPTLATLSEQKTATFNNTPSYNPITSFTPPPPKEQDPHHARLNALLSSGDGMDTFGNTGELRIPAQHTAPGTFVNSAGSGLGRINTKQTGTNPFLPNQYTGMPATTYNNSPGAFGGRQVPAATGPAGMSNGYGAGAFNSPQSANPFGQRPQQQNGQGDLIQF